MKNRIFKVVAVVALILSFAFSWVNSPAYAQPNPFKGLEKKPRKTQSIC